MNQGTCSVKILGQDLTYNMACLLIRSPFRLSPSHHFLHPTPYTVHFTPYALHPTPYTPHSKPETRDSNPEIRTLRSSREKSVLITDRKLLRRNVQQFRGGLVFKALSITTLQKCQAVLGRDLCECLYLRLIDCVYLSTLGSRVLGKKERNNRNQHSLPPHRVI